MRIRRLGLPGDLGWVIQAHGELYAAEHGWDPSFEALVARIVADYAADHDPAREAAWIAERHGVRVGSVFCVAADAGTAKLRVLLVHPDARGRGVGAALVEECLRFAKAAGYRRMTLWTVAGLAAANHIYRRAGFVLVDEEPLRSFGADLVGQTWTLAL